MTEKRFTFEKVVDILIPLFVIEVFIFANIVLIIILLCGLGVI